MEGATISDSRHIKHTTTYHAAKDQAEDPRILAFIIDFYKQHWGQDITWIVQPDDSDMQKAGVDVNINIPSLKRSLNIDNKSVRQNSDSDVFIETHSNTSSGRVGWSLDRSKFTDVIAYYWKYHGKIVFLDFWEMRDLALRMNETWESEYKIVTAYDNWKASQGYYVPLAEIERHIGKQPVYQFNEVKAEKARQVAIQVDKERGY